MNKLFCFYLFALLQHIAKKEERKTGIEIHKIGAGSAKNP